MTNEYVNYNASEVRDLAKSDPDFLAGLAMPDIFTFFFPPVFKALWNTLVYYAHSSREDEEWLEKVFAKLALGLPRGFGKTTVIKLFLLYCILFTDRKFLLVLAATAKHAINIISDLTDMLDEPNIREVFGDWRLGIEKDTQEVVKFGFLGRNIILAGIGAGGSVRGLNLKNSRPDVMVFDDIQSAEDAQSKTISDALQRWMVGTAMKAKDPQGCLTIFVANMYPTPNSLLRQLLDNPEWLKFVAGGINEKGESLWEELQPVAQLLREYKSDCASGNKDIFMAEVMNDPNVTANDLIDLSALPDYPYQDGDISLGSFIVIDPSNDKTNSDAVSLGYFEVFEGITPVAMDIVEGRFSPGDTIKEALKLCERYNCHVVAVESNAYQYSLLYWSNFIMHSLNISNIDFVEIYSGKLNKPTRILGMFKQYVAGELFIHEKAQALAHSQISNYRPLKPDNTDGILDLLTYAPKVIELYSALIASHSIVNIQAQQYTSVQTESLEQLSPF